MSASDLKKWWKQILFTLPWFCALGKSPKKQLVHVEKAIWNQPCNWTTVFPEVIKSLGMGLYKVRKRFYTSETMSLRPNYAENTSGILLFLLSLFLLELFTLKPLKDIKGRISMSWFNFHKLQNAKNSRKGQLRK